MRRELIGADRDEGRLELRLAHPLYGEAVHGRMPPTRMTAVKVRLADALAATSLERAGDLIRFAV